MLLWKKDENSIEQLADIQLRVAQYDFVFDTTLVPDFLLPEASRYKGKLYDISLAGGKAKRVRIDRVEYKVEGNSIVEAHLILSLLENPLPAIAVLLGAAALVGFAATVLLREIRLFAEKSPLFFTGTLLLAAAGVYFFNRKKSA